MTAQYRVERERVPRTFGAVTSGEEYSIVRSGEGTLVRGSDLVLMHKICELLNEEVEEGR